VPNEEDPLNYGYDNDRGDYICVPNDHIAYRYEIKEKLGHGSFGQTFKVWDHKRKILNAVKIIRNKKKFHA
jgi:dual specificity tyrosine-phosphorylation-regulated kinase 2/3/4